jgi:apolipoprotein N-acyltransferase
VRATELEFAAMKRTLFSQKPRRDGTALGFGLAFVVFGLLWLLRSVGLELQTVWLYPVILIGLGLAGLATLILRERR